MSIYTEIKKLFWWLRVISPLCCLLVYHFIRSLVQFYLMVLRTVQLEIRPTAGARSWMHRRKTRQSDESHSSSRALDFGRSGFFTRRCSSEAGHDVKERVPVTRAARPGAAGGSPPPSQISVQHFWSSFFFFYRRLSSFILYLTIFIFPFLFFFYYYFCTARGWLWTHGFIRAELGGMTVRKAGVLTSSNEWQHLPHQYISCF